MRLHTGYGLLFKICFVRDHVCECYIEFFTAHVAHFARGCGEVCTSVIYPPFPCCRPFFSVTLCLEEELLFSIICL